MDFSSIVSRDREIRRGDDEVSHYHLDYGVLKMGAQLGRGYQAIVYRAELYGQQVAVKQFNLNQNPKIELLGRLSHRNVIRLLGVCKNPPCIVTELCSCSLHNILHSNDLISFEQFTNWTIQIASGMEYLHAENVIHRDLKSQNILLAQDGSVRICDFDLSKEVTRPSLTITSFIGDFLCMAPEVVHQKYSRMVDVWSFGVVCWEMITQQRPYLGEDHVMANFLFRLGLHQLRLQFPVELPAELLVLLNQCLEFDPMRRPDFTCIRSQCELMTRQMQWDWHNLKEMWSVRKFEFTVNTQSIANLPLATSISIPTISFPSPIPFLETNEGRTCRNRLHVFSKFFQDHSACDFCNYTGAGKFEICDACQLMCHESCIVAAPIPCIPRPKIIFALQSIKQLWQCRSHEKLPVEQPQIWHYVLHCLLELERRNEIFLFQSYKEEIETISKEIIIEFFNNRIPKTFRKASRRLLRHILRRCGLQRRLEPVKQVEFLDALRHKSSDDAKAFIDSLEPKRKCTAALLFSHWKAYILKHPDCFFNINIETVWWVVFWWIGVDAPCDLWPKMRHMLLMNIELEFWDSLLRVQ